MAMQNTVNFSGSYVALITPMKADGKVDFDDLKKLVHWHIESGTHGLVILGTTAESATLDVQEQLNVLNTVIKENNGRLPIIVGNGSNSTADTIKKTQLFDELAIDGYLTVTPYYNKPTQKGMVAHFKAVAQSTAKPIILYNVPGRTGVDLSNESVIELMTVDNIVGIKDATGDLSRVEVMKQADSQFRLFSGDDLTGCKYVSEGGDGVISVTANVEPKLMAQMLNHLQSDNVEEGNAIDGRLSRLHIDLFIEPNPVPAKWALKEKGLISSDMVRLPLLPLEPNSEPVIKEALQQAK